MTQQIIYKKATSINELPADLKIFKTKIIIDKNKVHKLVENYTSIWKPFSINSPTKIKRSSAMIIASNTKNYEEILINDLRRDPFGKTQYEYFNEAKKTFDNFDFDDIQLLCGAMHFIKFLHDKIITIPKDKLKYFKIKKLQIFCMKFYTRLITFFSIFLVVQIKKQEKIKKQLIIKPIQKGEY